MLKYDLNIDICKNMSCCGFVKIEDLDIYEDLFFYLSEK
jgi:hypothetical protein